MALIPFSKQSLGEQGNEWRNTVPHSSFTKLTPTIKKNHHYSLSPTLLQSLPFQAKEGDEIDSVSLYPDLNSSGGQVSSSDEAIAKLPLSGTSRRDDAFVFTSFRTIIPRQIYNIRYFERSLNVSISDLAFVQSFPCWLHRQF